MRHVTQRTGTRGACAKNRSSHPTPSRAIQHSNSDSNPLWKLAAAVAAVLSAAAANAANDACSVDPATETLTCTGDQSAGIVVPANQPITTLTIRDLDAGTKIATNGTPAVNFTRTTGSRITLNAGTATSEVTLETIGFGGIGLYARSQGGASGVGTIAALGLKVPASAGGAGGPVIVNDDATITTTGDAAYGVYAENAIGGLAPEVEASLNALRARAERRRQRRRGRRRALDPVRGEPESHGLPAAARHLRSRAAARVRRRRRRGR